MNTTSLYHISGWVHLATSKVGDVFDLVPGPQHAEGLGVYFAESTPPPASTAEGAVRGVSAVVRISVETHAGWWRTKASLARKFARPRTWHSDGKTVACRVVSVDRIDGMRRLNCEHVFA